MVKNVQCYRISVKCDRRIHDENFLSGLNPGSYEWSTGRMSTGCMSMNM